MYTLDKPTEADRDDILALQAAWPALESPTAVHLKGRSFEQWLKEVRLAETAPTAPYVPATLYLLRRVGSREVLGALHLRHRLNERLLHSGGHIGYGLAPFARGKGIAPEMLRLGLEKARERGLERVLVTCDKANLPSAATIRHCGGVLENEVTHEDGQLVQRYWIEI